jgi:hypothetical protein
VRVTVAVVVLVRLGQLADDGRLGGGGLQPFVLSSLSQNGGIPGIAASGIRGLLSLRLHMPRQSGGISLPVREVSRRNAGQLEEVVFH